MDRELGFDLYTLRLLLFVVATITVCTCTVSASMSFYDIVRLEILADIPAWQDTILWVSFFYFGLYAGIRLIGRAGWMAIADTVDKAANGEPNIFAELVASDLPDLDNLGKI